MVGNKLKEEKAKILLNPQILEVVKAMDGVTKN